MLGLVIAGFFVPSLVSAYSEGRAPRVAAIAAIAGLGLIVWAVQGKPGGYSLNEVPEVFVRVVGRFVG